MYYVKKAGFLQSWLSPVAERMQCIFCCSPKTSLKTKSLMAFLDVLLSFSACNLSDALCASTFDY